MTERQNGPGKVLEQSEGLKDKLLDQLRALNAPFVMWNTRDKNAENRALLLAKISNENLLKFVKEKEGGATVALDELIHRLETGRIAPHEFLEEGDDDPGLPRFMTLSRLALAKLAKIEGEESDIETCIEELARRGIITSSDIHFGKHIPDRLKEITAKGEASGRIKWDPTIPPPPPTPESPQSPQSPIASIVPPGSTSHVDTGARTLMAKVQEMPVVGGDVITGEEDTTAIPVMQNASEYPEETMRPGPDQPTAPPPAVINTPSLSSGETTYDDLREIAERDPELVVGPAAYIFNDQGKLLSDRLPLLDRIGREAREYTIGSATTCDIRLDHASIKPIHGRIRIEEDKVFLKEEEGKFIKATGGVIGSKEWEEINPDIALKPIGPQGKNGNGNGPHSIARPIPLFKISPVDMVNKSELRQTLRTRAVMFKEEFDRIAESEGPDSATCCELIRMIDAILAYCNFEQVRCFTAAEHKELTAFFGKLEQTTRETRHKIRKALRQAIALRNTRRAVEKKNNEDEWERASKIIERENALDADALHLLPEEHPSSVEVPYAGKAFSIQNLSDAKPGSGITYYPAEILSRVTIGLHPINTHTIKAPTNVGRRKRDTYKNFMAELFEEDGKYYVRYLEGLVRIPTPDGFTPPPQEVFELEEGKSVHIGGKYMLTMESGQHAFSMGTFMPYLEKEKTGLIDQLLDQIQNQDHTTWEQDEEALGNLKEILSSDLPGKEQLKQRITKRLIAIYEDLIKKIIDWDETPDSGLFQTLILLLRASHEEGLFPDTYKFTASRLARAARDRVAKYLREAQHAYDTEPQKPKPRRFRKRRFQQEMELYETQLKAQEEAMQRADIGVVEIARFLEFELVTETSVEKHAPLSYMRKIKRAQTIRQLFERLEDEKEDTLTILEILNEECRGLEASDIFAQEEISTRSQHCEVDLKTYPHLTGPSSYIHKLGKIHASKAFERLDLKRSEQEIAADLRLIHGLLEQKIIVPTDLNTNMANIRTPAQIIDKLQKKEKEVKSERTEAERRKAKAIQQQLVEEQEARRRDEYIQHAKDMFFTLETARKADLEQPQEVESALITMMTAAPYALKAELAEAMADYKIRVPKKIEKTSFDESAEVEFAAEEREKNWREYQEEWEHLFLTLADTCADNVISGISASSGRHLLQTAMNNGYFTLDDLGSDEFEVQESLLERGVAGESFVQEHLERPIDDLEYLDFEPQNAENKGFWDSMKDRITQNRLEKLVNAWRAGENQLRYRRKIRRLHRASQNVYRWFEELKPTDEERALLQPGE